MGCERRSSSHHRLGVDPGGDARRGGRRALGKARRHRARRGGAADQRHPEAAGRHPHQQRRGASASAWADLADIVNAALARQRRSGLARATVELRLSEDMPLVHVDPVLIEQALGADPRQCRQVFAARFRHPHRGARAAPATAIAIARPRVPASPPRRRERMFERFYRGPPHHDDAPARASVCGSRARS